MNLHCALVQGRIRRCGRRNGRVGLIHASGRAGRKVDGPAANYVDQLKTVSSALHYQCTVVMRQPGLWLLGSKESLIRLLCVALASDNVLGEHLVKTPV